MARDLSGTVSAVPLDDADVPAVLSLAWAKEPSPAVAAFVRHARESFAPKERHGS